MLSQQAYWGRNPKYELFVREMPSPIRLVDPISADESLVDADERGDFVFVGFGQLFDIRADSVGGT